MTSCLVYTLNSCKAWECSRMDECSSTINTVVCVLSPFRDQRDIYVPLTKSLFKFAGITVSHFFSMLQSTLKYLYSVEPVRMHFPAKQPCTNDTVCNAAMQHCTLVTKGLKGRRWLWNFNVSNWSVKLNILYHLPLFREGIKTSWILLQSVLDRPAARRNYMYSPHPRWKWRVTELLR